MPSQHFMNSRDPAHSYVRMWVPWERDPLICMYSDNYLVVTLWAKMLFEFHH